MQISNHKVTFIVVDHLPRCGKMEAFQSSLAASPRFEVIKKKKEPAPAPATEHKSFEKSSEKPPTQKKKGTKFTKPKPRDSKPRARDSKPPVAHDPSRDSRTVFVGNIPAACSKSKIKKLFKACGTVESVRLHAIGSQQVDSVNAHVVMSSDEEAESCLSLNGSVLRGRHLRVDVGTQKSVVDTDTNKRSVFVGNLPFSADEEQLREVFTVCGEIQNIRIVRDPKTGIGKGFGFVTFKDKSGVVFALKQNNTAVLDKRCLRVYRSTDQGALQKQSKTSKAVRGAKSGSGKVRMTATKSFGKRRPDGTKNRYYRLPKE